MRKQYHFRPSQKGFYAWDVDKLVELSSELASIQIKLDGIRELDEPYWFGDGHAPTCREILGHIHLMNEAVLNYPIILCSEGRIMDGMHRVMKAALQGHNTINAVKFQRTPPPDFIDVQPEELPY